MAIPATPTPTTIVTEALNKYGIKSPTSAQITRAINYGLESVKDELWLRSKRWKSLQTIQYIPTVVGLSQYSLNDDYEDMLDVTIFDGRRGQVVDSSTNKLIYITPGLREEDLQGKIFTITFGTGVGAGEINSYDSGTGLITLTGTLTTGPAIGDYYLIADTQVQMDFQKITKFDRDVYIPGVRGKPYRVFHYSDSTTGDIFTESLPDQRYVLRCRYYSSLEMLDLSSTLYTTLLRRWKRILTHGVFVWLLEDNTDDRYDAQFGKLERMIQTLMAREIDGVNLSDFQREVGD